MPGTGFPAGAPSAYNTPPMALKIYTRTGDAGDTALFGGGRVGKDDRRVDAYGDVDELNAALGLARAIELMPRIDEVLVPLQRDLFAIGALLATPDRDKMHEQLAKARVDEARVAELEAKVAQIDAALADPSRFADAAALTRERGEIAAQLERAEAEFLALYEA